MGRRWHCEWQDSEDDLFQAYREATDTRLRSRLQALWQLRRGRTLADVAEWVGVQYRTVQTWVQWYRQGGLTEVRRRRQGGGSRAKLTAAQADALKAYADTGAVRTRGDAIQWVSDHYGITYTSWGMRHVFSRLRLKKKVPRPQNPKASVADQTAWQKGGSALRSTTRE